MVMPVGLVAALIAVLATAVLVRPALRALPEPVGAPGAEAKTPYAELPTGPFVAATTAASALACFAVVGFAPPAWWLAWSALSTVCVVAVAVDAATTWLPRRLTNAAWFLAAPGIALQAWLTSDVGALVGAAVGALACGVFFWLFSLPAGGIGFSDVRLMILVGAVTGAASPQLTWWAALLGTLLGVVHGIVHRLRQGATPFAYGPALLTGPFLALILLRLPLG